MSTLEELHAEAEELYNRRRMTVGTVTDQLKDAHVHAKTITADQVEKAAKAGYTDGFMKHAPQPHPAGSAWEDIPEDSRDSWRRVSRAALEAVGCVIEGGQHGNV